MFAGAPEPGRYPPRAMPSERLQRQIDRLLDEAEAAAAGNDWAQVRYVKPSRTNANDEFGQSLALTKGQLYVGAPLEDGGGSGADTNPAETPSSIPARSSCSSGRGEHSPRRTTSRGSDFTNHIQHDLR